MKAYSVTNTNIEDILDFLENDEKTFIFDMKNSKIQQKIKVFSPKKYSQQNYIGKSKLF